jgi:hypothetical protein
MSKRIKYPNGVIYIEGKLSSHEEKKLFFDGRSSLIKIELVCAAKILT